jgi:hypothetical protein
MLVEVRQISKAGPSREIVSDIENNGQLMSVTGNNEAERMPVYIMENTLQKRLSLKGQ